MTLTIEQLADNLAADLGEFYKVLRSRTGIAIRYDDSPAPVAMFEQEPDPRDGAQIMVVTFHPACPPQVAATIAIISEQYVETYVNQVTPTIEAEVN